jgi:hypothetical protein
MDFPEPQASRIDTTEDAADLFSLLSCCIKELSVQDLARISASSKSLRTACAAIVKRDLKQLLEAAVAQAAEADADCSRCRTAVIIGQAAPAWRTAYDLQVHAVAWLLRAAPAKAASDEAAECVASDEAVECVLRMPAVPEQAAVQLVKAGMRVSLAQLLSAADRMVKGVEVWVLAQQQLGVHTDIPQDAVDICRGNSSVFTRWVSCPLCSSSVPERWRAQLAPKQHVMLHGIGAEGVLVRLTRGLVAL